MNKKQIYAAIVRASSQGTIPISILEKQSPKTYTGFIEQYGYTRNSELLFNFLNPGVQKVCIECGKPTKFKRFQIGYAEYCGLACKYRPGNTRMQRIEATNLQRFGAKAPAQNSDVFAKVKRTLVERYGVEHPFESPAFLKKAQDTLERKYGVRFTSHLESANFKRRNSLLKSHGVEYPMQHPEILERYLKTRFLKKTVTLQGRKFKLQGYEPQALRLLTTLGVPVIGFEQIRTSIPYVEGPKRRRYIPDFLIGDLVVEVKSDYTAGLNGNTALRKNLVAKLKGVRAAGKDFLLLVMNKDGTLHKCCFNSFRLTVDIQTHRKAILESALVNF